MKNKKLIVNIIKFFISFIIFFGSGYIKNFLIIILNIKKLTPSISTILTCITNFIVLLLLILLFYKDLKKDFKIFKQNISNNIDTGFKYWMIGLLCMMISNILIALIFDANGANNEETVQSMIQSAPLFMFIAAGIIAPITEELLFRKNFRNIFKNNLIYILISGIIFGYLHIDTATSLSQFLYIIPYSSLGIAFAVMNCKTNTVFTSICMHALHNSVLTIFSILI